MPSWKVHRALYEKLRREVEGFVIWTPGLLERIDEIIDKEYGEHDLGRKAGLEGMESFYRMLRALWLEFGDVYDVLTESFLHADYFKKLDVEREKTHSSSFREWLVFFAKTTQNVQIFTTRSRSRSSSCSQCSPSSGRSKGPPHWRRL